MTKIVSTLKCTILLTVISLTMNSLIFFYSMWWAICFFFNPPLWLLLTFASNNNVFEVILSNKLIVYSINVMFYIVMGLNLDYGRFKKRKMRLVMQLKRRSSN